MPLGGRGARLRLPHHRTAVGGANVRPDPVLRQETERYTVGHGAPRLLRAPGRVQVRATPQSRFRRSIVARLNRR